MRPHRHVMILGADITDDFPKSVFVALGAVWTDERATGRVKFRAATQTKIAIGVRLAGLVSRIFLATR